ncbi:MAG: hypothetical protein ABUL49_00820, partial [bacterium]
PYGLHQDPSPYGTGYVLHAKMDPKNGHASFGYTFLGCTVKIKVPGSPAPPTDLAPPRANDILGQPSGVDTTDGSPLLSYPVVCTLGKTDFVVNGKTVNSTMFPAYIAPKIVITDLIPSDTPDTTKGEDQAR